MDQILQNSTKLAQITKIFKIIGSFQDQKRRIFQKKRIYQRFSQKFVAQCGCAFIYDDPITQRDKQRRFFKKSEFLNAFLKDVFRGAMRLRPSPRRPDQTPTANCLPLTACCLLLSPNVRPQPRTFDRHRELSIPTLDFWTLSPKCFWPYAHFLLANLASLRSPKRLLTRVCANLLTAELARVCASLRESARVCAKWAAPCLRAKPKPPENSIKKAHRGLNPRDQRWGANARRAAHLEAKQPRAAPTLPGMQDPHDDFWGASKISRKPQTRASCKRWYISSKVTSGPRTTAGVVPNAL